MVTGFKLKIDMIQKGLFEMEFMVGESAKNGRGGALRPLADLIRPQRLEDVLGQGHLLGEGGCLNLVMGSKKLESGRSQDEAEGFSGGALSSLILWGPAGVGKTSIARILARISGAEFVMVSAINSMTADIKKIFQNAEFRLRQNVRTLLMIDEIHHFNKTQQDLFLPYIEDGTIILIATTTENPSFHLNAALLSRCKVLTLKALDDDALKKLIDRVEGFLGRKLPLNDDGRAELINLACGDGRYLLNICQELVNSKIKADLDGQQLRKIADKKSAIFDKKGDTHYNLISAFHKSLRGSDVDAALYYLARMLVAKQDPYYILRRMAKFATEDIGIADPEAVVQVMAAKDIYEFLGSPEGDYALSHAAIYLASAPKSNATYIAHNLAIEAAQNSNYLNPPKHILNAPTKMMKEQDYSRGYIYDHDTKYAFSGQEYFPAELVRKGRPKYYEPKDFGFEREVKKRLSYWEGLRKKLAKE